MENRCQSWGHNHTTPCYPTLEKTLVIITRVEGVDFTSEPMSVERLANVTYAMQERGIRYRTAPK